MPFPKQKFTPGYSSASAPPKSTSAISKTPNTNSDISSNNNNNNNSSNSNTNSKDVLRSIQVLHPSRYYTNYCTHQSSNYHTTTNKQRFSSLLLEYGERELYDWAVVASSSSSSNSNLRRKRSSARNNGNGNGNGNSINSSNGSVRSFSSSSSSLTAASTNTQTQNGIRKNRKKKSSSQSAEIAEGTNAMKRINGRLFLCTKSIVFEPSDMSRGVIRCPFEKMTDGPALSSSNGGNGSGNGIGNPNMNQYQQQHQQQYQNQHQQECKTISFTTTKYIIMKKNNIITPYTIIDKAADNKDTNTGSALTNKKNDTTFSFTFLFSKPTQFLQICNTLCQNPKSSKTGTTNNPMSLPMIVPKFNTQNFVHLTETPQTTSLTSYILGPLLSKPGCTMITQEYFYFQPMQGIGGGVGGGDGNIGGHDDHNPIFPHSNSTSTSNSVGVFSWELNSIIATARRYHGLKDSALELFFNEYGDHDDGMNIDIENHYDDSNRMKDAKKMDKRKNAKKKKKKKESSSMNESSVSDGTSGNGSHSSSLLIAFESNKDRELVMKLLPKIRYVNDTAIVTTTNDNNSHHLNSHEEDNDNNDDRSSTDSKKKIVKVICHTDASFLKQVIQYWMKGILSNFDYLLALNSAAGRSFHDLSRYPVFPWVLNDYESSKLDLKDISLNTQGGISEMKEDIKINMFRDLTKPIGALNQERLDQFKERWKSMEDMEDVASFLYGTHYSAPGYCLYYLVRLMPEHMLCLQTGKYDAPDRLFHSIKNCYSSLLSNPADLKESIPQFYDPKSGVDLLLNLSGLQLGITQNGTIINDVELPNWAKSPKDFLKKNRKALESDYCSHYLPDWIDLIFGEKSRGASAEEALNVFHPTSYLSPRDLEEMESEEMKTTAELQATEFGICPDMLFCAPHPHKDDNLSDIGKLLNLDNNRASDTDINENGHLDNDANADSREWELLSSHEGTPFESTNSDDKPNHQLPSNGAKDQSSWISNSRSQDALSANQSGYLQDTGSSNEETEMIVSNDEFYTIGDNTNGDKMKKIPLSGSGDSNRNSDEVTSLRNGTFGVSSSQHEAKKLSHTSITSLSSKDSFDNSNQTVRNDRDEKGAWELKTIASSEMHSDAVSGCHITFGKRKSNITTTSLDGSLMVHILPNLLSEHQDMRRRGFSSNKTYLSQTSSSRFSYVGKSSSGTITATSESDRVKNSSQRFHSFRSHTSSDPLACLAVVGGDEDDNISSKNGDGSQIAFAGGHDDVILAYGVNSACGLASVYSHRDAITGLDLVSTSHHNIKNIGRMGTHVMISGSWDATVKLWNVSITKGENVDINKEPLVELFDAESSVSDVSGILGNSLENNEKRLLIAAGSTDGSVTVWLWDGQEKSVLHREEAKRGYGPCSTVKWSSSSNEKDGKEVIFLFAGFGNGRIASFAFKEERIYPVGILDVGSPVNCLSVINRTIFAGCGDGGMRLTSVGRDGHLDHKPMLFPSVNGGSSPPLTSIHSVLVATGEHDATNKSNIQNARYLCATGAKDGSVSTFYVDEL